MSCDRNTTGQSSDLCTRCGICCNGVLFDQVPVAAEESDRLRAVGFNLWQAKEQTVFAQPCAMLAGTVCTVYPDRPRTCSNYRCALLKRVEAAETSFDEALELVEKAKALMAAVRPHLESRTTSGSAGKAWGRAFRAWQDMPPEARARDSEASFVLQVAVLNLFLDRHFRSGQQRRVMDSE